MKAITTRGTVTASGHLIVPVPQDVPIGEHDVVVVIDAKQNENGEKVQALENPIHDWGPWPPALSLRREDLYNEWGR